MTIAHIARCGLWVVPTLEVFGNGYHPFKQCPVNGLALTGHATDDSSAGGNNGSAFAGFNANTPFLNVSIGLIMLFVRFLPMFATLAIAGSLAAKKKVAVSSGTLPTHNAMFIFLLIFVVLLVGALSFFPALSLGPVAEFFQMIA